MPYPFDPVVGEDGELRLRGLDPPHDIDKVRALLQAKPELRKKLTAAV